MTVVQQEPREQVEKSSKQERRKAIKAESREARRRKGGNWNVAGLSRGQATLAVCLPLSSMRLPLYQRADRCALPA